MLVLRCVVTNYLWFWSIDFVSLLVDICVWYTGCCVSCTSVSSSTATPKGDLHAANLIVLLGMKMGVNTRNILYWCLLRLLCITVILLYNLARYVICSFFYPLFPPFRLLHPPLPSLFQLPVHSIVCYELSAHVHTQCWSSMCTHTHEHLMDIRNKFAVQMIRLLSSCLLGTLPCWCLDLLHLELRS